MSPFLQFVLILAIVIGLVVPVFFVQIGLSLNLRTLGLETLAFNLTVVLDQVINATQRVVGDLDEPHTGIFLVLPVACAYGMHKSGKHGS